MMTRMTGRRGDTVTAGMLHRRRRGDGERVGSVVWDGGGGESAAMVTRGRRGDGATVGMRRRKPQER